MKIVDNRKLWFIFSGVLIVLSIISLFVWGLKFGIDFTGGSLLEVEVSETFEVSEIRSAIDGAGFTGASIQTTGETGILIRTEDLSEDQHQELLSVLQTKFETVDELRFDSIGPIIGNELRRTAVSGVLLTLILIGLYVAWAFRKVSEPVASWKYGFLTIFTAFHDVIITIGIFSVLGNLYGWEVGAAFVAAILTILGYSINDTVVVFDRTRENLIRRTADTFESTVEQSIQQTFSRSVNTSVTTLLALIAIFLFGGATTQPFALALIIGIAVGTYSSLFIASPLLVAWELRRK